MMKEGGGVTSLDFKGWGIPQKDKDVFMRGKVKLTEEKQAYGRESLLRPRNVLTAEIHSYGREPKVERMVSLNPSSG